MSTAITAGPRGGTAAAERVAGRRSARLVSGSLARVFLAEFCALTSFYLLLSVTPMDASAAGAGAAGAGLVTGVLLLGTVAAEIAAPAAMQRFRHSGLLAVGLLLLGVPVLALLRRDGLAVIVSVSLVRGFGCPAPWPPPGCSARPSRPRSAAGGPGAQATGTATSGCWSRRCCCRRPA